MPVFSAPASITFFQDIRRPSSNSAHTYPPTDRTEVDLELGQARNTSPSTPWELASNHDLSSGVAGLPPPTLPSPDDVEPDYGTRSDPHNTSPPRDYLEYGQRLLNLVYTLTRIIVLILRAVSEAPRTAAHRDDSSPR